MTNQPQSCRECWHAIPRTNDTILFQCRWSENVKHPFWHRKVAPETVFGDEGEDCPAFERKDDADDA